MLACFGVGPVLRRLGVSLALALCVLGGRAADAASPAPAPSEPATVTITILTRDDVTRAGIAHAHVQLESDGRRYEGFTDGGGTARFPAIVPDRYIVELERSDYFFGEARLVTIGQGGGQFAFDGKRTKLRRIGNVAARAKTPARGTATSAEPAADISGSLLGNPYAIPDLGIGSNGALRIGAQDSSTTTATIDGAPIFPSGAPIPAGLLGGDFFGSGSVVPSAAGAPGGALALSTFDPVLDWQGFIEARPSSYGGDTWGVRERGTTGTIGISFTHAVQDTATSARNDAFYADTSGRAYDHDFLTTVSGDALKLRAPLSEDAFVTFSAGDLTFVTPQTCSVIEGTLPCGSGPDDRVTETTTYGILEHDATLGHASLTTQLFASNTTDGVDDAGALFLGTPIGFADSIVTRRIGLRESSTFAVSRTHDATLSVVATRDVSNVNQQLVTPVQPIPPAATSALSAVLNVPLLTLKHVSADAGAGFDSSDGLAKVETDAHAAYAFDNRNSVSVRTQANALGSPVYGSPAVAPVNALQFDCTGRALGTGPLASALPPSVSSASLAYTYNAAPFEASLTYREVTSRNAPVQAIVPGTSLASDLFAPGFFGAAAGAGGTICGTPQAIAPATTAFQISSIAQTKLEDRVTAQVGSKIGSRTKIDVSYVIDRARAFGFADQLRSAINLTPGSQLPTIPRTQANASIDYAASHDVSFEANANAFGAGSQYERTAFASIDAGVHVKIGSGDLVLAAQNIGNAAAPTFERFAPFPFLPQPFATRTYSVRYRLPFGNSFADRAAVLNPPIQANDSRTVMYIQNDFEGADHPDFLGVDSSSPLCGPELVPRAKAILGDLRAYAAYVETERAAGRVPAAQTVDGIVFSVVPARVGDTIRLAFPHDGRRVSPLFRCGRIHSGDVSTAQKLGIYTPDARTRYENSIWVVYYAPQAGLYFAPDAVDETGVPPHFAPFPSRVPVERTTIDDRTCPATDRRAVTDVLTELQAAIPAYYGGKPPASPPHDFRIGAHPAKGGTWLEIAFDDPYLANAVGSCLDTRYATAPQLEAEGLGATTNFMSIDYAPAVGFYRRGF